MDRAEEPKRSVPRTDEGPGDLLQRRKASRRRSVSREFLDFSRVGRPRKL